MREEEEDLEGSAVLGSQQNIGACFKNRPILLDSRREMQSAMRWRRGLRRDAVCHRPATQREECAAAQLKARTHVPGSSSVDL